MKLLRLFLVIACSLMVSMGPAFGQEHQTSCTRVTAVGKDCEQQVWTKVRNDGRVCETCNGSKEKKEDQ